MRSVRTLAVAVALAATGLSVAAPASAFAATAGAPAVALASAVNPSTIDPTQATSLSIHKYLGSPTGQVNNGTAQNVTLPPLQGVAFDVYNVTGVDLTTNAGWAAATALQSYPVTQTDITNGYVTVNGTKYNLVKVATVTTDATGTAVFTPNGTTSQPKDGLYLTNENLSASTNIVNTQTGATVAANSITPITPFFSTLPMTDPSGTSWMYNVNAYPKNQSNSITKTVQDQQSVTSSMGTSLTSTADKTVDYTLTGSITAGMTGTQMGAYAIADQLPKGMTFTSIASVKLIGTNSTASTLTAGTDYNVYVNGTLWTGTGTAPDGALVQVAMTQSGLDKLAAAKSADSTTNVVVDLQASGTVPTGSLANTAYVIPSNAYWQSVTNNPTATYNPDSSQPGGGDTPFVDNTTTGTTTPVTTTISSNTVYTQYGDALLTKTDAQSGATLAGAKFDLYSATISGADLTAPKADYCTNATVVANGTSTPGTNITTTSSDLIMSGLTTGSNGTIDITGLQASNFYNNNLQPSPTGGNYIVYCLVETQAPTGYNLNAQPTAFFVTAVDGTTAVKQTAVSVQDEKTNLANNLPLTGGAGASILGIGGLVVVGGTLAARAASRKRREDEENELA